MPSSAPPCIIVVVMGDHVALTDSARRESTSNGVIMESFSCLRLAEGGYALSFYPFRTRAFSPRGGMHLTYSETLRVVDHEVDSETPGALLDRISNTPSKVTTMPRRLNFTFACALPWSYRQCTGGLMLLSGPLVRVFHFSTVHYQHK